MSIFQHIDDYQKLYIGKNFFVIKDRFPMKDPRGGIRHCVTGKGSYQNRVIIVSQGKKPGKAGFKIILTNSFLILPI